MTMSGSCSTRERHERVGRSAQTNFTSVRCSTESSISRKVEHSFPRRIVIAIVHPTADAAEP
jgi:hypothetical protein